MKSRVILSYSTTDEPVARAIEHGFIQAQIPVAVDLFALSIGDSALGSISKVVAASDFMILLISPDALRTDWMSELETLISSEWQQRAITLIPVKVLPCVVPKYLSKWKVIDLTRSFDKGLERLIQVVRIAPRLDISRLSGYEFEELVFQLLRSYGFSKIKRTYGGADSGIDFAAEFNVKDPFGRDTSQNWMVQVKASRNKTDIRALQQFIGFSSWRTEKPRALFVTATQLTSAAKEWIASMSRHNLPELTVLEGTDITRLLLARPKIAEKFFPIN